MPIVTAHGREKEIPDLFELPVEKAKELAREEGFKFKILESRFDSFYPPGIVIEQIPPPFTISKVGRRIKVVVSEGEKLYPMPDITGSTLRDALFKLEELSFTVPDDSIKLVFSDYYPDGVITEQPFAPGTMLGGRTRLSLIVSMGKIPGEFIVPEVIAMNLKQARESILRAGLSVGDISFVQHAHADSGLVVSQSLPASTKTEFMKPIDLGISLGKPDEE